VIGTAPRGGTATQPRRHLLAPPLADHVVLTRRQKDHPAMKLLMFSTTAHTRSPVLEIFAREPRQFLGGPAEACADHDRAGELKALGPWSSEKSRSPAQIDDQVVELPPLRPCVVSWVKASGPWAPADQRLSGRRAFRW